MNYLKVYKLHFHLKLPKILPKITKNFTDEVIAMPSWKCSHCGYSLEAETPPEQCPSCKKKCEFLDNTCYTPDCESEGKDNRIG
jgi:rubrerythrin